MALETFAPDYHSYGTEESEPDVRTDGINRITRKWTFTFQGSDADVITHRNWLLARLGREQVGFGDGYMLETGTPFWFTPIGEPAPIAVVCVAMPTPRRPIDYDTSVLVASFRQYFGSTS